MKLAYLFQWSKTQIWSCISLKRFVEHISHHMPQRAGEQTDGRTRIYSKLLRFRSMSLWRNQAKPTMFPVGYFWSIGEQFTPAKPDKAYNVLRRLLVVFSGSFHFCGTRSGIQRSTLYTFIILLGFGGDFTFAEPGKAYNFPSWLLIVNRETCNFNDKKISKNIWSTDVVSGRAHFKKLT